MARPDKAAAVAELSEQFSQSAGAVLTEYRGLSVAQLQELRRVLEGNATYAVVKNTLTKIAARDAGVDGLEDLLAGPSAIAFISGDPVEAAKGLRDFARNNQSLVIKGGVLDGKSVSPGEIAQMADLESREVLLAKMAGAMQASLQNAAYMFNAPLAQMARVLGALQGQVEADAPADAAPADAPADAAPADAPADAAPADEAPADAETADTASAEAAPADAPADETAAPDAAPDDSTPTET